MYVLRYVKSGVIKMLNLIFVNILLENHTLDPLGVTFSRPAT